MLCYSSVSIMRPCMSLILAHALFVNRPNLDQHGCRTLHMFCSSLLAILPEHNSKNRGFLRYSDVWDSYDQWEHFILEMPDGRRFLRCDRKNRNHFYFEGTVPDIPDVGDFYDECEPGCPKNRNSRKNPSIGKS